jgi:hypothetical protein
MFDSNQSKYRQSTRFASGNFPPKIFRKAPHVALRQKELPKATGGHSHINISFTDKDVQMRP